MERSVKKLFRILLQSVLAVIPVATAAQQPAGDFARQLADFRYSLYPLLERMPDSLVMSVDFSGYGALNEKAAGFLAGRDSEVADYQRGILRGYGGAAEPSLEGYAVDLDPEEADTLDGEMADLAGMLAHPVARVYFADPVDLVRTVISAMNAARQPLDEYAAGLNRDRIAAPRIVTREEPDGRWRITVDRYSQVWIFRYDPSTQRLALLGRYERR